MTQISDKDIVVRNMSQSELELVTSWAAAEGWNPGRHDANAFFHTDPNGFFVAELNGKIVGSVSAVKYDTSFGFVGFFIVLPEFRHLGVGLKLGKCALERLAGLNVGVDGVLQQVANYERSGLKFIYKNVRYNFFSDAQNNSYADRLLPIANVNFDDIVRFDRRFFPAPREVFLRNWFRQPNSHTFVKVENGVIKGIGMIRDAFEGKRIGPLFADNVQIADEILSHLASFATNGEPIAIDMPEVNGVVQELVKRHKMSKVFETARMYTKGEPKLFSAGIFGVTSFELG